MERESVIESYLRKQAKYNDFLCYKFVSPANDGVPDRVLIGHGRTIFVETKAPGKKPRKLQERVFQRMRDHGAYVFVMDTKDEIDRFFGSFESILNIKTESDVKI